MIIRKIVVGSDYVGSSMHYVVGQPVMGSSYKIHEIKERLEKVQVWVLKGEDGSGEIFLWKEFNQNMPVTIEYNLNFE
jgi:hypothetical protein